MNEIQGLSSFKKFEEFLDNLEIENSNSSKIKFIRKDNNIQISLKSILNKFLFFQENNNNEQSLKFTKKIFEKIEKLNLTQESNSDIIEKMKNKILNFQLNHVNKIRFENHKMIITHLKEVYINDFFKALNANQPEKITFSQIMFRDDYNVWLQIIKNYQVFCNRLKSYIISKKQSIYRIPNIIHFIGFEDDFKSNVIRETWRKHHPNWHIKLWNEQEGTILINELRNEFVNVGKAWDNATTIKEKTNILLLLILYRNGGVYVSNDLICNGKINGLHCLTEFYIGQSVNKHFYTNSIWVGNAIIGIKQNSLEMKKILENIREKQKEEDCLNDINDRTGEGLLTGHLYKLMADEYKSNIENSKIVVLPPSYFYPIHWNLRDRLYHLRENNDIQATFKTCINIAQDWTKGVHIENCHTWLTQSMFDDIHSSKSTVKVVEVEKQNISIEVTLEVNRDNLSIRTVDGNYLLNVSGDLKLKELGVVTGQPDARLSKLDYLIGWSYWDWAKNQQSFSMQSIIEGHKKRIEALEKDLNQLNYSVKIINNVDYNTAYSINEIKYIDQRAKDHHSLESQEQCIFIGPNGGKFNGNFLSAFNANQRIAYSPEQWQKKSNGWSKEWKQVRKIMNLSFAV